MGRLLKLTVVISAHVKAIPIRHHQEVADFFVQQVSPYTQSKLAAIGQPIAGKRALNHAEFAITGALVSFRPSIFFRSVFSLAKSCTCVSRALSRSSTVGSTARHPTAKMRSKTVERKTG